MGGYDAFKEYEGRRYTGMKIGRSHRWQYAVGEWKETKVTPDTWQIHYSVPKRRAGHAPEGSGVPVGTQYHWYILAHQTVTKLDANSYTTEMAGIKYKLAHKRADKAAWSATDRAQRRRLIALLEETIVELQREPEEATKADSVTKRRSSPTTGKQSTSVDPPARSKARTSATGPDTRRAA
jgi:hypothetical protein